MVRGSEMLLLLSLFLRAAGKEVDIKKTTSFIGNEGLPFVLFKFSEAKHSSSPTLFCVHD